MKNITLIILSLISSLKIFSQSHSCCMATAANTDFSSFASDNSFVMQHVDPLPYIGEEHQGEMISFETTDSKTAAAYSLKAKSETNKYVLILHEWWGLNDYIKLTADKIYEDLGNVNVIALDLYDGKIAQTKQEAQKYMAELDKEHALAIIKGLQKKIGSSAKIATLGWCMGGGMSLQTSLVFNEQSMGCVMYYGMPETDLEKIQSIKFPVLFFLANQDKWITPEIVNTFEKQMNDSGKTIKVISYDAVHAFANPSNPNYNEKAASEAYQLSIDFLGKALQ